jgi:hypothetical protein
MSVGDSIDFLRSKALLKPIMSSEVVNTNFMCRFLDFCGEGFLSMVDLDIKILSSELTHEKDKINGILGRLNVVGNICGRCYDRTHMNIEFSNKIKLEVTESILKELE